MQPGSTALRVFRSTEVKIINFWSPIQCCLASAIVRWAYWPRSHQASRSRPPLSIIDGLIINECSRDQRLNVPSKARRSSIGRLQVRRGSSASAALQPRCYENSWNKKHRGTGIALQSSVKHLFMDLQSSAAASLQTRCLPATLCG
jgi:hypothetical protein